MGVAIAILKTSPIIVDLAITILAFILLLLDKYTVQLNVAVVHD